MKKKKRIYLPFSAPWRKRLLPLARIVDDIQRQLEIGIGWRKRYDKHFTFSAYSDRSEEEISLLFSMIRYACPDLKNIGALDNPRGLGKLIRGRVEGERPKLKRIKIRKEERPV